MDCVLVKCVYVCVYVCVCVCVYVSGGGGADLWDWTRSLRVCSAMEGRGRDPGQRKQSREVDEKRYTYLLL